MKNRHRIALVIGLCGWASAAMGQTAIYQPMGRWVDPQQAAFGRWEAARQPWGPRASASSTGEPRLAGLRPKSLELLQDGLLRKFTSKVKTEAIARQHILRMSSNRAGLNVLQGAMAEAMFVDRNRGEGWQYVEKPNAPQHDFTRRLPGRPPENVQVKFHEDGNPATYAADMRKDYLAHKFVIPDDHYAALRSHLERRYQDFKASGDISKADEVARNMGRLKKLGATSVEIREGVSTSARRCAGERYATYTSLGASLVLAVGPTIWDWANGDLAGNQAMYRATRALSVLGVGVGTDVFLMNVRQGALRGSVRGNVIVGTAVLITETTWLLYEHGWSRAFNEPQFYESVAGSVTGLAVGLVASGAAIAWVPGPGWVVGGAAIITGAVAGTVGYIGGRSTTHMLFEMIAPEKLQQRQRERLAEVTVEIQRQMAALVALPLN